MRVGGERGLKVKENNLGFLFVECKLYVSNWELINILWFIKDDRKKCLR